MEDASLIAIVEDDATIAAVEREILEDEGYRVAMLAARSPAGVAALAPALVLIDVDGANTGHSFLRALKGDPATRAIPVLVVTALGGPALDDLRADLEAWECRLLFKPFGLDEFLREVRSRLAEAGRVDDRAKATGGDSAG